MKIKSLFEKFKKLGLFEEKDYTDIEGDDKLTDTQKFTGKRVKIKVGNAYGSVGTILAYNEETDTVIVRVAGNKNISVGIKDVEILNPNVYVKKEKTKLPKEK